MSSRLMPPKPGAIASTAATISSGSFVVRQIGHASTPPNSLKRSALPSITGIAASGPMSPSPSTALPSVTTATVFRLIVRFHALSGSCGDRLGRRARRRACRPSRGRRASSPARSSHVDLAAEVQQERCGRRRARPRRRRPRGSARTIASAWAASVASTLTSRILRRRLDADEIDRVEQSARVRDRAREIGEAARPVVETHPQREAERRGVVAAHMLILPRETSTPWSARLDG